MIWRLFSRSPRRQAIEALYGRIAAGSRVPVLYRDLGVPDTVEGRFECLTLHVVLMLRRLQRLPAPAADVSQDLVDFTFKQLDLALRDLGVGDLSVGKRIKKLAQAFYGRAEAYNAALDTADAEALATALARNLVGGEKASPALAAYVLACERTLSGHDLAALLEGRWSWPDPAMIMDAP